MLNEMIADYENRLSLLVSAGATRHLTRSVLDTDREGEFVFAHVSADGRLKPSSYVDDGIADTRP